MRLCRAAGNWQKIWFAAPPVPVVTWRADRVVLAVGYSGGHLCLFEIDERAAAQQQLAMTAPPIVTQCFLLANMFDPTAETNSRSGWEAEVRDDVIEDLPNF